MERPPEVTNSADLFRRDYPVGTWTAFLVMQFADPWESCPYLSAVTTALEPYGIKVFRADMKSYHPDLYWNIATAVYCSDIVIAIFPHRTDCSHNPNVSIEVGMSLALNKDICILKDDRINILPTDLVGRLYRKFNENNLQADISQAISHWLSGIGVPLSKESFDNLLKSGVTLRSVSDYLEYRYGRATKLPAHQNALQRWCAALLHVEINTISKLHELMIATESVRLFHRMGREPGCRTCELMHAVQIAYPSIDEWLKTFNVSKSEQEVDLKRSRDYYASLIKNTHNNSRSEQDVHGNTH